MAVRMRVAIHVAGNHDPRVLVGSTKEHGINWEPGQEITVTEELAEKFSRSGLAERIPDSPPKQPETAALETTENTVRPFARPRKRA